MINNSAGRYEEKKQPKIKIICVEIDANVHGI